MVTQLIIAVKFKLKGYRQTMFTALSVLLLLLLLFHNTSGPGFDSRWRPNIFNSVLFKCERERIHLIIIIIIIN